METITGVCKHCQGTGLLAWTKTTAIPRHDCRGSGCFVIHYDLFNDRTRLKGIRTVDGKSVKAFYDTKILIRNMARCKKCDEIIESIHRHDFVTCKCGAVSVDGGTDYINRTGNLSDIEELSEFA